MSAQTQIGFEAGINDNLLRYLSDSIDYASDRQCVLLYNEMSIQEHLQYNPSTGMLSGVEDNGTERTSLLANQALVFMLVGVDKAWMQLIAHYFIRDGITKVKMMEIITKIISKLKQYKFNLVATVSDTSAVNVEAIKDSGATAKAPFYFINGHKIVHLFNPLHLMKCTRDMFFKYPVESSTNVNGKELSGLAKWECIVEAASFDQEVHFRLMPQITAAHLNPELQEAMSDVRIAEETLKYNVASFINFLVNHGKMNESALGTAHFVYAVDKIFDSLNGKTDPDPGGFLNEVSKSSGHVKYWKSTIKEIENWKFLDKNTLGGEHVRSLAQDGWIHTLNGMLILVKKTNLYNLRLETFNLGLLEDMFERMRFSWGENQTPQFRNLTVEQFTVALKKRVIKNVPKGSGACYGEQFEMIDDFKLLLRDEAITSTYEKSELDLIDSFSVAHLSGYIAKKILSTLQCSACETFLKINDDLTSSLFDDKCVIEPSEQLAVIVGRGVTMMEQEFKKSLKEKNIFTYLKNYLTNNLDVVINCCEHSECVKLAIISGICKIGLPKICTDFSSQVRADASECSKTT